MDNSRREKSRKRHFVMPLVFGFFSYDNHIPSLCYYHSVITIVAAKGSFFPRLSLYQKAVRPRERD